MNNDPVIFTGGVENGERPGREGVCFYCNATIGQPHGGECVIVQRRVKVRYTFDLEISVPRHWSSADIVDHRNFSSWCAVNAHGDIERFAETVGCECKFFLCEYVGEVSE